MQVTGLDHINIATSDLDRLCEFYTGVLGLRLVKRTVNQDAIDTYHFFYADAEGSPHQGMQATATWEEISQ